MCLSKAYLERKDGIELVAEEVASLEIKDEKLVLKTLFGEEKEIGAKISQIDFMTHSIFLKE